MKHNDFHNQVSFVYIHKRESNDSDNSFLKAWEHYSLLFKNLTVCGYVLFIIFYFNNIYFSPVYPSHPLPSRGQVHDCLGLLRHLPQRHVAGRRRLRQLPADVTGGVPLHHLLLLLPQQVCSSISSLYLIGMTLLVFEWTQLNLVEYLLVLLNWCGFRKKKDFLSFFYVCSNIFNLGVRFLKCSNSNQTHKNLSLVYHLNLLTNQGWT